MGIPRMKKKLTDKERSALVRDFCAAAMAEPDRADLQLRLLDQALRDLIPKISESLEAAADTVEDINFRFKKASGLKHGITILTTGKFNPVRTIPLDINTDFADLFSETQIIALPGYIELHKAAREADVAIALTGLLADERGAPQLVLDMTKAYKQGGLRKTYRYPYLAETEEPAPARASTSRKFSV
jgi:hypothetical protein